MDRRQTTIGAHSRSRPAAFEYVAEQIRRELTLGLIAPGQALPTERELARLLRVGRATVQSALAILKKEGLIESRRGRSGGTFVSVAAGIDTATADAARRELRPREVVILEALAFRSQVEPIVCSLAALFRTEADLYDIRVSDAAARRAADDPTFMLHDSEFHMAVARASHNRFYVEALHNSRMVLEEVLAVLPASDLWHTRSHREHNSIIAALEEGDEHAATQAMCGHVTTTDVFAKALMHAL